MKKTKEKEKNIEKIDIITWLKKKKYSKRI